LSTWLARAEAWLLEPHDSLPRESHPVQAGPVEPPPAPVRPVVAVIGLARGCGATTVARAIAVELASRDPAGAALVASSRGARGAPPLPTPASARLARSLRGLGCEGVRSVGRLCLVGECPLPPVRPAPLVLDTGRERSGAAVADRTVLVAGPRVEPSLAQVVSASLERSGRAPTVVANRIEEADRWEAIGALAIGESRLAAGLALAGRESRARLAAAMREIVDRWEQEPW
jgi:hypothetical protein